MESKGSDGEPIMTLNQHSASSRVPMAAHMRALSLPPNQWAIRRTLNKHMSNRIPGVHVSHSGQFIRIGPTTTVISELRNHKEMVRIKHEKLCIDGPARPLINAFFFQQTASLPRDAVG